jgi:hypothetical protein
VKLLDTAGKKLQQAAAVVRAVASKPHRCDPTGFRCDCVRKAEINARRSGLGSWLGLRRARWLR